MKIKKYADDNNVSINDKVIGSDSEQGGETKNYSFKKIIDLFKSQGIATIEDLDKKTDKGDYLGTTKELNDRVVTLEENSGGEGSQTTIDTAFYDKQFSTTMSLIHDVTKPNLNINITANLSLVITGTANGDSGIVNLYFSGTEVATLSGITNLIVTGAGEMIPVYFIHDTDGLKWYSDNISNGGSSVDLETLDERYAQNTNTVLWHNTPYLNGGAISNIGVNVTGIGTNWDSTSIGNKIVKDNGEEAIILSVNNSTLITVEPFTTDSIGNNFEIFSKLLEVNSNGGFTFRTSKGIVVLEVNEYGEGINIPFTLESNNRVKIDNSLTNINGVSLLEGTVEIPSYGNMKSGSGNSKDIGIKRFSPGYWNIYNGEDDGVFAGIVLKDIVVRQNVSYASDTEADADITLLSGSIYWITGDRIPRKKP